MADSVWPSVVSGVGGLLGSLITAQANWKMNQENNQLQQDLANQAYAQNLAQWERENAYNSPSAQIQRLKSAGLNPSMLYGQGAPMNVAGESPQKEIADTQPIQMQDPVSSGINAALLSAQIDKTRAEAEETRSQIPVNNQRASEIETSIKELVEKTRGLAIANEVNDAAKISDIARRIAENDLSYKQALEGAKYAAAMAKDLANKLHYETQKAHNDKKISAEKVREAKALADKAIEDFEKSKFFGQVYRNANSLMKPLSSGFGLIKSIFERYIEMGQELNDYYTDVHNGYRLYGDY